MTKRSSHKSFRSSHSKFHSRPHHTSTSHRHRRTTPISTISSHKFGGSSLYHDSYTYPVNGFRYEDPLTEELNRQKWQKLYNYRWICLIAVVVCILGLTVGIIFSYDIPALMGLAAFAAFAAICILLCLCTTISRHNYYQRLASYSKSWGDIPKNPNSNIKTVQPLSQELQINKIADTTPEQPQQLQLKSRDQQMEQLRTEEPPARLEVIHEQDDNMPGQVGV